MLDSRQGHICSWEDFWKLLKMHSRVWMGHFDLVWLRVVGLCRVGQVRDVGFGTYVGVQEELAVWLGKI